MSVAIIDYGAGNLLSVANALRSLGTQARVAATPDDLAGASHLVLPGVGAFGDCMAALEQRGFAAPLREWLAADRPFLGICLGYQLLFEGSDESPGIPGLGALPGRVVRFTDHGLKVPHIGWNAADPANPALPWWTGLGPHPFFYFVHSYFPAPADPALVAATTTYGDTFASAVARGRLLATQFHPEKSQSAGLRLLENFLARTADRPGPA